MQGLWRGCLPSLIMVSNPTAQYVLYEWLVARLAEWRGRTAKAGEAHAAADMQSCTGCNSKFNVKSVGGGQSVSCFSESPKQKGIRKYKKQSSTHWQQYITSEWTASGHRAAGTGGTLPC